MKRPVPLVSVAKAVAGTVMIAALSVLLLPIYPLIPLPAAYMTAREGWVAGVVVAVVAAALLYVAPGPGTALMTFLLVASTGVPLGIAVRKGWRFPRTLAVVAVSLLAAFVAYGLVAWLGFGVSYAEIEEQMQAVILETTGAYQAGMSAAVAEAVAGSLQWLVSAMPYLAAGVLGMMAILGAAVVIGLAHLVLPRLRKPVPVRMSLSGLRLHWGLAYVSIAGLALLLFARGGEGWRVALLYAGIDLLMVSQTLFFLQGLAVVRWLSQARQWRGGAQALALVVAVLAQFLQFTGLVGLLDTWIDYRKRFALRSSGPSSPN